MKMLHFQNQLAAAAAAPKLEPFLNLNQEEQLGSLNISTPYQSPWMNPTSSSSSLEPVLFDDGTLELSEMDTLAYQIGGIDKRGGLDQTYESAKSLKMVALSTDVSDPQIEILNAFVKKCNPTEDSYLKVDPHGSFLQDARSVKLGQGYTMGPVVQQDLCGSIHSDPKEPSAKEAKDDVLKVPAKRSLGTRPSQLRPTKRGALHQEVGAREISQREIHIQSERERRKGMNNLFERMRSLLPSQIQKVDKSTIVSEIINYIQSLQQNLENLNKKKAKLSSPGGVTAHIKTEPSCAESIQSDCTDSDTSLSPSLNEDQCTRETSRVTVHCNGHDIFITVCCLRKANILPAIIYVVEDHNLQITSANVSTTDAVSFYCLHCKALGTPELTTKQSLRTALKKFVCSDSQICFE